MGALSWWHWLVIIAAFILIFGAKKLPDAARGIGRSLRILKSEVAAMNEESGKSTTADDHGFDQPAQIATPAAQQTPVQQVPAPQAAPIPQAAPVHQQAPAPQAPAPQAAAAPVQQQAPAAPAQQESAQQVPVEEPAPLTTDQP